MNKTLIRRHSSGLFVCANGSVYIPSTNRSPARITFGSNGTYLHFKYKGKYYSVHRLVAETFIDNPHGLRYVDHIDRNPYNNNVDNLRWASAKENRLNTDVCENSISRYGIRSTDDRTEWQRRYRSTEEGRERIRKYNLKYKSKKVSSCV